APATPKIVNTAMRSRSNGPPEKYVLAKYAAANRVADTAIPNMMLSSARRSGLSALGWGVRTFRCSDTKAQPPNPANSAAHHKKGCGKYVTNQCCMERILSMTTERHGPVIEVLRRDDTCQNFPERFSSIRRT